MTDPLITQAAIEAAASDLSQQVLPQAWDESWEELTKASRREFRDAATAALSAALPHIVAALAAQAGENPYPTYPPYRGVRVGNPARKAWAEGAAAAAAAEWERTREIGNIIEEALTNLAYQGEGQWVEMLEDAVADLIERGGE